MRNHVAAVASQSALSAAGVILVTRLQNKQHKIDLPPLLGLVSDWLNRILLLHGVAQKSEREKFRSFLEILEYCLAENLIF